MNLHPLKYYSFSIQLLIQISWPNLIYGVTQKQGSEASLFNETSTLAAALGVTKFMTIIAMNLVTLCCAPYSPHGC